MQASSSDVQSEHRWLDASIVGAFYERPGCSDFHGFGCHLETDRQASTKLSRALERMRRWQPHRHPAQRTVVRGRAASRRGTGLSESAEGQSAEAGRLKEKGRPCCKQGAAQKIAGTTMPHNTTDRPRKAGGVSILHISQAKQEQARHLDHMADRELAIGRHAAAERLSHEAYQLRQEAQQ
jgi:hypothetical protein